MREQHRSLFNTRNVSGRPWGSCVGGILLKSRLQLLQLAEAELGVIQQGSVVLWADRRCCGAVVPSHAHIRAISSVTLGVSSPK